MANNLGNISDLNNFSATEGKLSDTQQEKVDELTTVVSDTLGTTDIQNLKLLLQDVINIMMQNKENLRKGLEYTNLSKNIIEEELSEIEQDDTLQKLYDYRNEALGSDFIEVLNISSTQFTDFFNQVTELQYRLNVLSYKIVFFEEQIKSIDNKITIVNNYIIALDNAGGTI